MNVCRMRKTPVIVFINKMDREGKDPFDLLDEIESELQISVRPLSFPINQGAKFKGVYNIFEQNLNLYTPNKQYISESIELNDVNSKDLDNFVGESDANKLREDLELVNGVYSDFDVNQYLKGEVAPVFFGSALNNFGVKELLDCFIKIAPSPRPIASIERTVSPYEEPFSGFVFKIHANMDPNHRSCIAFVKICSGRFERNGNYKHIRHNRMMRFSSPTAFMAQKKETVDEAFAGDIIGLPDNGVFKIGDTLTEGEIIHFKGLPSFSPEMFRYIENADPMKTKQLEKGISQLMDEGVAQLFISEYNNRKIIGTVGQLQFEVIQYRLLHEYGAQCRFEPLSLYKACWIESDDAATLELFKKRKFQYMAKDREGRDVFMADSSYILQMAQQDFEKIHSNYEKLIQNIKERKNQFESLEKDDRKIVSIFGEIDFKRRYYWTYKAVTIDYDFDEEGKFQTAEVQVNLLLDTDFTLTESILSLDQETVNAEIQKEYQNAIAFHAINEMGAGALFDPK